MHLNTIIKKFRRNTLTGSSEATVLLFVGNAPGIGLVYTETNIQPYLRIHSGASDVSDCSSGELHMVVGVGVGDVSVGVGVDVDVGERGCELCSMQGAANADAVDRAVVDIEEDNSSRNSASFLFFSCGGEEGTLWYRDSAATA